MIRVAVKLLKCGRYLHRGDRPQQLDEELQQEIMFIRDRMANEIQVSGTLSVEY